MGCTKGGCQSFCLSVQRTNGGDACAFGGFRGENSLLTAAVYWKQERKVRSPSALAVLWLNPGVTVSYFPAALEIKRQQRRQFAIFIVAAYARIYWARVRFSVEYFPPDIPQ